MSGQTGGAGDGRGQAADRRAAAAEIISRLTARQQSVAAAESLTGGLLAAALTDIPGASAAFRGGIVAYATELKAVLLGVDPGVLDAHGAVSPDVAAAMAQGVRSRLGATYGVSTTGVAGPGPAEGKAAGTVYIAVSAAQISGDAAGGTQVRRLALAGSRDVIRAGTVAEALALLLVMMREETR